MLNYLVTYIIVSIFYYSIKNLAKYFNHLESKSFSFTSALYFVKSLSFHVFRSTLPGGAGTRGRQAEQRALRVRPRVLHFRCLAHLPHPSPNPATGYKNKANVETLDVKVHSKSWLPLGCPFSCFTEERQALRPIKRGTIGRKWN